MSLIFPYSSFDLMKKSTDAPVRLMQISAPISPPLSAGQNNPYRDIGVGRPPPGRGKKPSSQRVRQEQHEVSGLSNCFWSGKGKRTRRARQERRRCFSCRRGHRFPGIRSCFSRSQTQLSFPLVLSWPQCCQSKVIFEQIDA